MFQITKTFHEGYLAGITITEQVSFEMALGHYPGILGTTPYEVIACEPIAAQQAPKCSPPFGEGFFLFALPKLELT